MAVPTSDDLNQRFDISSQIAVERTDWALELALSDVERAVGIDVYNEIFNAATSTVEDSPDDADSTTTNEEASRLRDVTNAVYFKAMAYCLENANLRIRASGSVKREQDAGSPAMVSSAQVVNEYMTPEEITTMKAGLEAKAADLLQPYLLDEDLNTFVEYAIVRG